MNIFGRRYREDERDTAMKLTARLNNAIYRWLYIQREKSVATPFLTWLGR